jgi:DNA-binding MarR family transcriptional regulator
MTVATDRETTLRELGESLEAVFGALRRLKGRDVHGPHSFPQWRLIRMLGRHGEQSAVQLAAAAEVTPATVTPMLDHLVTAGLVERTRSEEDRRVVLTRLTAEGRRLHEHKDAEITGKWAAALEGLSDSELEAGIAVLKRVRGFFDAL